MDFEFFMPVRIYSGKNAVARNREVFKKYGSKCGILTSKTGARKSGALYDVVPVLNEMSVDFVIYDSITENPLLSSCHEAGEFFRKNSVDFILGIGGGSALDAAKAVAIYAANAGLKPRDIYLRKYDNEPLPVLLIGTTSGTGSEVSGVSVLTDGETGRKKSISGPDCYAKVVFADSTYTESMPDGVTVSTALDALSHAIEGYFTPRCTDIPELFARKAIPLLWNGLKDIYGGAAIDSRLHENLYFGSLYAGMILNPCGTAFPHPLGYVLTENYGIPHGRACTAFMTEFIGRAFAFENERAAGLMKMMNTEREEFCRIIEKLTDLPDISMTKDEAKKFCSRWETVLPGNFKSSPGGFDRNEAEKIFIRRFVK